LKRNTPFFSFVAEQPEDRRLDMSQHQTALGPHYVPMGDQVVVAQFENVLSIEVNQRVRAFARLIEQKQIQGVRQLIPAFNSLAIHYDPLVVDYDTLVDKLTALSHALSQGDATQGRIVHIPVVYGGKYGPDLEDVARLTGLTTDEVIDIHLSRAYLVYMIGFIAGFPYCGDIDERLVLPRRANPRVRVEKGTICIANRQTGIYTIASPGGWHLIGWTPMETFNPYHEPPSLLLAGDYVQFVPITASEAERWDEKRQREWEQQWNSLK
jgi:inhibitor of KinA